MVGHKDFDKESDNLVWIGPSNLTDLGGGLIQTPDRYYPGTLLLMNRGLPVARENDDGYTEVTDQTFQLKQVSTHPLNWIMVGYLKKS